MDIAVQKCSDEVKQTQDQKNTDFRPCFPFLFIRMPFLSHFVKTVRLSASRYTSYISLKSSSVAFSFF